MASSKKILEMAVDKRNDDLKYDYDADGVITAADARLADRGENGIEPATANGQQYNALSLANQYLDQYRNSKFNYDVYSDPVYNQAREAYIRQGQLAAKDVQAQAAAMTGGYGNSYGAMAAQQQYNMALTQMNDIVPQLEQNAYGRWQDEQNRNLSLAQIYLDRENQLYNRAYNEAVLGAQYKDYEGLRGLGINTDHYETLEQADEEWAQLQKDRTMKEWDQADTTYAWNIALNAAQFGDYGKLHELGIDTSTQEKKDLIDMAVQWAQWGDYSLLRELGVDTTYLQTLQNYELAQIYGYGDTSSGSSGGGGGKNRQYNYDQTTDNQTTDKPTSNNTTDKDDKTGSGFMSVALGGGSTGHFSPGISAASVAESMGYTNILPTAAGVIATDPTDGRIGYIRVDEDGNGSVTPAGYGQPTWDWKKNYKNVVIK